VEQVNQEIREKQLIRRFDFFTVQNGPQRGAVILCFLGFGVVATLTWPSVGVKPNTWKSWGFGVLRDSRMFRARQQGPKHLALGCSWCHWKGLEE